MGARPESAYAGDGAARIAASLLGLKMKVKVLWCRSGGLFVVLLFFLWGWWLRGARFSAYGREGGLADGKVPEERCKVDGKGSLYAYLGRQRGV